MTKLIKTKPSSFEEEISQLVWVDAMVEEHESIMKKNVWEVVLRPKEKLVVGSRWIYKVKHAADGSIEKYKAKLAAKTFSKVEGVDYEECFALVSRYSSIRSIITLVVKMGCKIHEMDVRTAFLNGVVEEEIYIEQPEGFETYDREPHVLTQESIVWSQTGVPSMAHLDQQLSHWIGLHKK